MTLIPLQGSLFISKRQMKKRNPKFFNLGGLPDAVYFEAARELHKLQGSHVDPLPSTRKLIQEML